MERSEEAEEWGSFYFFELPKIVMMSKVIYHCYYGCIVCHLNGNLPPFESDQSAT